MDFIKFIFFYLSITLILGCDTGTVEPNNARAGYDYFPLQKGHYVIYQVEDTDYQIDGDVVVSNFQLKEQVIDSFINQSGTYSYIFQREIRTDETEEWEIESVLTARLENGTLIVQEGNIPYVKLAFPIEQGKVWDGHSFNAQEEEIYKIDSVDFRYITDNQDTIPNSVTIIHADNEDFIVQLDRRYEIYGRNIGLVYKEDITLDYCSNDDCKGQQIVESGREYRQSLISYGKD